MKVRNVFGLMLSVVLLLLLAGSSLAREPQPAGPSEAVGVNASPAANAPWFKITVDKFDVGQYTSVAIDPVNNTTYVSYYDETYKDLRMAKYVGSGGNCGPDNDWSCETVDSAGDVGKYSSIAVDPTDNYPVIAYYDATNHALKLAIGSGGGWTIKIIQDPPFSFSAGMYASLKVDSTGKTHIAYYFSNLMGPDSLWYAKHVGGGAGNCGGNDYQCDLVDSGDQVGKYASLALDGSDQPRIAYYDGGNNALWYAFHDGVKWNHLKILPSNSGQYASLYVDNEDIPHIAHLYNNGKFGYAVYVGSGGNCGFDSPSTTFLWQCDEIDSMGFGLSLAVDAAGYPIIAYQKGGSLNVARPIGALGKFIGNCGPANPYPYPRWYCETIDPFGSLGPVVNGDFVSIDLNSSGLATIAYYSKCCVPSIGKLKVTYQQFQDFLPLVMKNH